MEAVAKKIKDKHYFKKSVWYKMCNICLRKQKLNLQMKKGPGGKKSVADSVCCRPRTSCIKNKTKKQARRIENDDRSMCSCVKSGTSQT